MKILLCNERFLFRFGVDRVLLLLGEGLMRRGHTVSVMANRLDQKPLESFAENIIEVPQGRNGYLNLNEFTAQWIDDYLREHLRGSERPDLVIVGGWPFFATIPVFRAHGIKVVFLDCGAVPLDGMDEGQRITQEKLRALRRTYIPQCDGVIAISRFIAQTQSETDAAHCAPITAILLGADHLERPVWSLGAGHSTDEAPARLSALRASGKKLILNLGRWENDNYKNSKALIDVMRRVLEQVPNAVALVLSDGKDMVVPDNMVDRILAIGYPSDDALHSLIKAVDVGVSVSLWEGFNLPIAEMQWSGKPVVAFDVGAHPEVVLHPWFLARDVAEMAAKLCACLEQDGLPAREHQSAIERFRADFRWEQVVDRYEERLLNVATATESGRASNYQLFVDVSNSARDPANSGVIRVTRSLCRALQQWCSPIFVLWDGSTNAYVYPTQGEYQQLGAFNGPAQLPYHMVSPDDCRLVLSGADVTGRRVDGRWLMLTETTMEANGKRIRDIAQNLGLQLAAVFYDAIPVMRPDLCKDVRIRENHAAYMTGLANYKVIFPISHYSGQCLADFWRDRKIAGTKILPALLPEQFLAGPRIATPALFDSNRIRILCVSTLEPRKNHSTLLEAVRLLSVQHPKTDWSLTLIGNRYAGSDDIASMVENACAKNFRIRWLGIADDRQLRSEYESCSFTVYPSSIEGYGMPIVESLWHAKPCICHEDGVMAELAVDGGCLTTNVLDAQQLSNAIFRLGTERELYDTLALQAGTRRMGDWNEYAEGIVREMFGSDVLAGIRPTPIGNIALNAKRPPPERTGTPREQFPTRDWKDILYPGCLTDQWQMNDSERLALTALLHRHMPRCCIEVGTYKAGSLSLIAQYAQSVFSIDIDPTIPKRYSFFDNVSFLTGSSEIILPLLFDELNRQEIAVDFILIDGDHSAKGVKRDLDLVLQYKPKAPLFIVMHDCFNEECRRGMLEANWQSSKYLRWVDLDFIPGRLIEHGGGGSGELWGGLACAYLEPGEHGGIIHVGESAGQMQSWLSRRRELIAAA
jgi:glycosyltransferase involved in cell wall biosynthesis